MPKAVLALLGLGVVALLADVVLVSIGAGAHDQIVRNSLVTGASFAAAAATLLAAAGRPRGERGPALVLGAAILSYSLGSFLLFFVLGSLTNFPTPSDLSWLAFYPLVAISIGLLVRRQRQTDQAGISLDAVIASLAIVAVGYKLIFEGVINLSSASAVVGGQLSYSILDFGLLTMLIVVCARSRTGVGRAYLALAAGLLLMLGCDVVLVQQYSDGSYMPGTLLNAGWPAAMLLLALSTRLGSSLKWSGALRGRALSGWIVASFIVSFALLIDEALRSDPNAFVIALSALVPCLVVIRLIAAVQANDRLMQDNAEIISAAGEGILRTNLRGQITAANPAALEMLGYSLHEIIGRRAHDLIHHSRRDGTAYPGSECPTRDTLKTGATRRITDEVFWRKDGSSLAVDYTSAPVRESGRAIGAVTVFDDVTTQRQAKELLSHQADHDSLTGLFNRRRFGEEVSGQLAYAQRYSRPGALLLLDLDTFKSVNDTYGHPAGDRLLRDTGASLRRSVRKTDEVGRIGGDEFAVLLREAGASEAIDIAAKINAGIEAESTPAVTASIGIATFDGGPRTPDDLMIAADTALYDAKEAGRSKAILHRGDRSEVV